MATYEKYEKYAAFRKMGLRPQRAVEYARIISTYKRLKDLDLIHDHFEIEEDGTTVVQMRCWCPGCGNFREVVDTILKPGESPDPLRNLWVLDLMEVANSQIRYHLMDFGVNDPVDLFRWRCV